MRRKAGVYVEWTIYNARFVLAALYFIVSLRLAWFVVQSIGVAVGFSPIAAQESATLDMLVLVDGMMVASVVYLITIGSYLIYVKPKLFDEVNPTGKDRPPALDHLNPAVLKKHISASLVTISAVNLIRLLLENETGSWEVLTMKIAFHLMFLIGFYIFWRASHDITNHEEKEEPHHA